MLLPLLCFALVGMVVGSFLNVVIDRLPAGESLIQPPSHCPYCGRRITALEMIPILSYLRLRGRCRSCSAPIPRRVLLVEALSGALFAFLWWRFGPTPGLALVTLYSCILLVVLFIDLEHKLVLNVVVGPAIGLALLATLLGRVLGLPKAPTTLFQLLVRQGSAAWLSPLVGIDSRIVGGVLAFLIFFVIWFVAPEGIGAGDVKLAPFAGLVTAFPGAIYAVFGSFVLGGIVAVFLLVARRAGRKTAIPFAPFLVITTFIVMVATNAFSR
jgi:leader peptidase (prepilin peptidase) / N-methyltransferase